MRVAERACVLDPVEVLRLSEFELCRFVSAVPKKSSFATAAPRPARRESERVIFMQSCAVVQCAVYSELVNRREKTNRLKLYGFTWLYGRFNFGRAAPALLYYFNPISNRDKHTVTQQFFSASAA